MIRRVLVALILLWVFGFVFFVLALPRPAGPERTDGIVVPTGGPNRIGRGLALLADGQAQRMLISGVDRRVRAAELAATQNVPLALMDRVDLGHEAVDTRSNGSETARWIERRRIKSVRLVTTDWHMRRARFELEQAIGDGVPIVSDAVRSDPSLSVLLREYNKYLLRRAAVLVGL